MSNLLNIKWPENFRDHEYGVVTYNTTQLGKSCDYVLERVCRSQDEAESTAREFNESGRNAVVVYQETTDDFNDELVVPRVALLEY